MKKIVATLLTSVFVGAAVAGIGYKSKGFTDWSRDTWLGTNGKDITETDKTPDGEDMSVAVDGNGNAIKNGTSMPAAMTFLRSTTSSDNTSASVTVSATVSPSGAYYTEPTWSVAWQDETVTDNIDEYVTVSAVANKTLFAKIDCKSAFDTKINLVFSVKDYYGEIQTATCELNYLSRVIDIDYLMLRKTTDKQMLYAVQPTQYKKAANLPYIENNYYHKISYFGSVPNYYGVDDIGFVWSKGTVRDDSIIYSAPSLRIQQALVKSATETTTRGTIDFTSEDTSYPFIDFRWVKNGGYLNVSPFNQSASVTVRVYFTFQNWSPAVENDFYFDFSVLMNTDIQNVSLSVTDHVFG